MISKNHANRNFKPSLRYIAIMCGYPGAGKSAVAHFLRDQIRWENIEHISIVSRYKFLKKYLPNKKPNEPCDPQQMACINEEFYTEVKYKLNESNLIILDGTFHTKDKRIMAYKFARRHKCVPILIHCQCKDTEILLERLNWQLEKGNKQYYNYTTEQVIKKYTDTFEDIDEQEGVPCIIEFNTIYYQPEIIYVEEQIADFADYIYYLFNRKYLKWHQHQSFLPSKNTQRKTHRTR